MKQVLAAIVVGALTLSASDCRADSDDIFLSGTDDGGTYLGEVLRKKEKAETPESNGALAENIEKLYKGSDDDTTFTGPIRRLLEKAGENPNKSNHWEDFENLDAAESEAYHTSFEYLMKKELSKPIPRHKPFGSKLDDIESSVRKLRGTPDIEKDLKNFLPKKSVNQRGY